MAFERKERKHGESRGPGAGGAGAGAGGARRPFFKRRKTCPFSSKHSPTIDYKDPRLLGKYVSERGKIVPSRIAKSPAQAGT